MKPRAKIVATVGPATSDPHILKRVLEAGADVIRINLSHGSSAEHAETFARIRSVSAELGAHVPVILDLMGPRYRLGRMDEPKSLERGQLVVIGPPGAGIDLPIDDLKLLEHLKVGNRFLVGDGLVELIVVSEEDGSFTAKVINGGSVSSRKGINLPDSDLPFTISSKDRRDLKLAVQLEADYVAASYVGSGEDIKALRRIIRRAGGDIPLIAKLERARAIEHLHGIVSAADAVMVARGDLGVELPFERVPLAQKRIIQLSNFYARPVITATQMLESMIEHARPTRAEASDVANAILDGTDAVMLSGETAVGKYPLNALKAIVNIGTEIERSGFLVRGPRYLTHPGLRSRGGASPREHAVAAATVDAVRRVNAPAIIVLTKSGFSARLVTSYRPTVPVFAVTPDAHTYRQLAAVWGVRPVLAERLEMSYERQAEFGRQCVLDSGVGEPGASVAVTAGFPFHESGSTNTMRLERL